MGCGSESEELDRIVEELSGYLRAHRQAADTLDGIKDWWLPGNRFQGVHPDALRKALERLVEQGDLARVESGNGLLLYVNRAGRRLH
jgi:hypothetical protein